MNDFKHTADAGELLREAVGHPNDDGTLGQIADDAARAVRRRTGENERLKNQLSEAATA